MNILKIISSVSALVLVSLLIIKTVEAGGKYHTEVNNYYNSSEVIQTYVQNSGVALAAASGQHHYKATTALQWSVGGAYSSLGDNSAVSFGLGKQYESVFLSTSYSTDGRDSVITGSASGVF